MLEYLLECLLMLRAVVFEIRAFKVEAAILDFRLIKSSRKVGAEKRNTTACTQFYSNVSTAATHRAYFSKHACLT